ncbi:uncharacterized protein G2W53_003996 [Senna tora]|uniref:Uncharacterized protein n=1 Tax=Senna tora TaxID=362788 RepID=A0A834XC72_9FABA|nr:uncharacterized protein G2W53_003996 [Senna tora]
MLTRKPISQRAERGANTSQEKVQRNGLDIMDCGSDMLIYIRWMILFTMMDKYNEKWLFAHVTM